MDTRYFDDLHVGDTFVSIGRTITETDLVNFISYTFFAEELFTSADYVLNRSVFKKRIVPGPLTLSLSIGLGTLIGWNRESAMAMLGMDEVRYLAPVVVGDTIHTELCIVEKKEPAEADRGVVIVGHTVKNQDGQSVLRYTTTRLMKRRARSAP
ncbi:MAG TPA: MaoC/PaaZ C-terminal domain-containing protein [Dehalococcoidia bacterium]|nr:MaoC/PaaZ C-terminal domain-containing protein [Dehalococcoidia bacterium]